MSNISDAVSYSSSVRMTVHMLNAGGMGVVWFATGSLRIYKNCITEDGQEEWEDLEGEGWE